MKNAFYFSFPRVWCWDNLFIDLIINCLLLLCRIRYSQTFFKFFFQVDSSYHSNFTLTRTILLTKWTFLNLKLLSTNRTLYDSSCVSE